MADFFVDLDGIGSNWQDYVLKNHFPSFSDIEELNQHPQREELIREVYAKDTHLFLKLPPIDKYNVIINHLKKRMVNWMVLTSAGSLHPDFNMARGDKIRYLQKHFKIPADKVIVTEESSDKQFWSRPGRTLIDDFRRNCDEWEEMGGTAILVEPNIYDVDQVCDKIDAILGVTGE